MSADSAIDINDTGDGHYRVELRGPAPANRDFVLRFFQAMNDGDVDFIAGAYADDGTLHPDPDVSMKVYADTGQVEVLDIKNQQRLPLQGLYQMPGLQQKWQANLFLGNWLSYCFKSGYRFCIDNRNDPGSLVEKTAEIA